MENSTTTTTLSSTTSSTTTLSSTTSSTQPITETTETELCSQCNEPPANFCRCHISERCCKNGHLWYFDTGGNRLEGTSHKVESVENSEVCKQCNEPVKFYCKCEISERLCKNGHSWYYNSNGDRLEGTTHV